MSVRRWRVSSCCEAGYWALLGERVSQHLAHHARQRGARDVFAADPTHALRRDRGFRQTRAEHDQLQRKMREHVGHNAWNAMPRNSPRAGAACRRKLWRVRNGTRDDEVSAPCGGWYLGHPAEQAFGGAATLQHMAVGANSIERGANAHQEY